MESVGYTRRSRKKIATKKKILGAAARLFEKKGVSKTTVQDVTTEADIAYATFYNYFDSLDDLVGAVIEQALVVVGKSIDQYNEKLEEHTMICAVAVRTVLRILYNDPAADWLFTHPKELVSAMEKALKPYAIQDLKQAIERGDVKPFCHPETVVRCALWSIAGMYTASENREDILALEEELVALYLSLIGVNPELFEELSTHSRQFVDEQPLPSRIDWA